MRDPAGAVAGRIYAFRDVSSDRLVEQLKSGFVSTVSHELRAPLTSIYGFAETLLREDVAFGDEERRTFLGYIASEAQRLTGIVDALLSVARLEAGGLQVQFAPTDRRATWSRTSWRAPSASFRTARRLRRRGAGGAPRRLGRPRQGAAGARQPRRQRAQVLAAQAAPSPSPRGGPGTPCRCASLDEGSGVPQSEQERIFTEVLPRRGHDARARRDRARALHRARARERDGRPACGSTRRWATGGCFVFELPSPATEAAERRV